MENDKKIIIAIGVLTLVILGGIVALGGKTAPGPVEPIKVEKGEITRPESPSIGPANAKVTLVEFADFQCPACGAMHPVLKKLTTEYKDQLRWVHRHFPLPMHGNAQLASQAAEAAVSQNKFWEMHNKLFEGQKQWETAVNPENKFIDYAKELGLDEQKFKSALKDSKVIDRVRLDMGDGESLGVDSTPTFFINGQKYDGANSYEALKARIEEELKK